MMRHFMAVLSLLFTASFGFGVGNQNVTFIIISQNNDFNDKLAEDLKENIKEQAGALKLDEPKIFISNKQFNTPAHWTIFPLIIPILNAAEKNTDWIVFLEDRAIVSVKVLLNGLKKYNPDKEIWIGHALHDSDATIIHHFAFHEDPSFFKYPNFGSGFVLSIPLLKKLKVRIENGFKQLDFHIDPGYEFALFVYDDGQGVMVQHDDMFCTKEGSNCAVYPRKFEPCDDADASSIFFAIKTCKQFHKDRVEIVKKTWLRYTTKSAFFSDIEDPDISTKSLGIPNTEQGHCQKTIAILQYALKEFGNDTSLRWLALVDDDTILSVSRIANLVTCYEHSNHPLILGERYRFRTQGFDYPTGGAGILINKKALKLLTDLCICPRIDSPDDMVLGACAEEQGITLVHVHQMHQARPNDYAPGRLATDNAISFHKHWMLDPLQVYEQWFLKDDENYSKKSKIRTEL